MRRILSPLLKEEQETGNMTLFAQGQSLYMTYCASCHGRDKKGTQQYPSLMGVKDRLSDEAVLDKIQNGVGVMPGFASVMEGKEEAITAFLYDLQNNPEQVVNAESEQESQDEYDRYINTTGYVTWTDPSGNPALKAPWGTLNALNLSTGEYEWKIPLGNNENLQENGATETGSEGKAGPIVTAGGLIFISGSQDKKLRAFEKSTGKLLWETTLPGVNNATVSTYQINGKQYVALSVGGTEDNLSGSIMSFALP